MTAVLADIEAEAAWRRGHEVEAGFEARLDTAFARLRPPICRMPRVLAVGLDEGERLARGVVRRLLGLYRRFVPERIRRLARLVVRAEGASGR